MSDMLYIKKNVRKEKLKKYQILNISKKQHYAGKTVVMKTKTYMHLLNGKKGKKWRIKPARETFFKVTVKPSVIKRKIST